MADNAPVHFVHQYSTNIQLLLQQQGSRLRNALMTGSHVGQQACPVNQVQAITANKVVARFAPMSRVDAILDRRWVFPVDYDLPQLVDSFDMLRLIADPTSSYVQNAVNAIGRAMDEEIITAFFGTAKTGQEGATSTSFNTTASTSGGQVVATAFGASATCGLTVAKLKEAKRVLMANNVDLERDPLFCAISSAEHDSLLSEAQIISMDYNDRPVLQEGRIMRFLGVNFIHTELIRAGRGLDDSASTTSTPVPLWAKSGMYLGLWNDIQTDVDQRKDLQGLPWQAYCKATFGSTRLDEKRVVKIWCK
jgi:hypothetical protein